MFVQPSGIGQCAFNLIGSVLAGVAVERQLTVGRWLAVYFGAGLAGNIASYLWFPAQAGGGSSDGVAGLIGALILIWWLTCSEPWWPGYLYGAFFAAYLTGLRDDHGIGLLTGILIALLLTAAPTALRNHGRQPRPVNQRSRASRGAARPGRRRRAAEWRCFH